MEAHISSSSGTKLFVLFCALSDALLRVSPSNFMIERRMHVPSNNTTESDIFTNPGGCFRTKTCANLGGYCHKSKKNAQISHCCLCECSGSKNLFYSLFRGCTTGSEANEKTIVRGQGCLFYMASFGKNRIPAIYDSLQLNQSGTELEITNKNRSLPNILSFQDTWCYPRRIYYLTKFGKERLIFENSCLETMDMSMIVNSRTGLINRYLKFIQSNESDWDVLRGKLLKIEILCKSRKENATEMVSCLLLRVNGTYNDDVAVVSHHSPLVCPPAPPYIPPPTTSVPTTPAARRYLGHKIGGSLAGCVLVITLVVLAVIFLRKRRGRGKEEIEMVAEDAGEPFLDEVTISPPENVDEAGVNTDPTNVCDDVRVSSGGIVVEEGKGKDDLTLETSGGTKT